MNQFEQVKFITIANDVSNGIIKLDNFLHRKSSETITRKVNDRFIICFPAELLNFEFPVKWFGPFRGKFKFNKHSVHFSIEDDLMICW